MGPYTTQSKHKLEMVQRRAARYCTNRFHNTSAVTDTLQDLQWETLESRRMKSQLIMLFKIINDLVDIPAEEYLTPASTRTRALHSKKLRQYPTKADTFKFSIFPRTIPAWNRLLLLRPTSAGAEYSYIQLSVRGRAQQPASKIRGFLELCRLGDRTSGRYCSRIGLITQIGSEKPGCKSFLSF